LLNFLIFVLEKSENLFIRIHDPQDLKEISPGATTPPDL